MKSYASKKDLREMMVQMQKEFPLFGKIGRLALNPVAFACAWVVVCFNRWRKH